MSASTAPFDSARYRQVLGHFPTGVTVITASGDPHPVGMAVGSFSSVSLDPPLVAFFAGRSSSTWPKIEAAGAFCVNILAEDQEGVCRRFASKDEDKFSGLGWTPAGTGAPLLDGVLAWIDCDIDSVVDAGDHVCVMGKVRDLGVGHDGAPLVFFRGGYGRFAV
ncbi:MAG TPA: flavin reductase family protein [Acidimicrobiales bacterium]|nr:flavin reductase family protein [Acidimicrobiales bacterium]